MPKISKKSISHIAGCLLILLPTIQIARLHTPIDHTSTLLTHLSLMFIGYLLLILPKNENLKLILTTSILAQLIFLFSPTYFNDFFRYLWDGKMSLHGINPFAYFPWTLHDTPETAALANVWYWDLMFFKWTHTIYGPTLQYIFHLAAIIKEDSALALKSLFFLSNIGSISIGIKLLDHFKKPRTLIALLALNPLFLFESLSTAHLEPIIIFFLLFTIYLSVKNKHLFGGISFAFLTLTKYFPLLLLPVFLTKQSIKKSTLFLVAATTAGILLYLPFTKNIELDLLIESLKNFSNNWVLSPGLFAFIKSLITFIHPTNATEITKQFLTLTTLFSFILIYLHHTKPLPCVASAKQGKPFRTWRYETAIFDCIYWLFFVLVIFSSVVFSWYVLWFACLLPFIRYKLTGIVFSFTILFQYVLLKFDGIEHSTYKYLEHGEILSNQLLIWIPVFLSLTYELFIKKKNVLVLYSRLPTSDLIGKTRLGKEIENQDVANQFARAIIFDMLDEYSKGQGEFDIVWYYTGNKDEFINNNHYHITEFVECKTTEISMDIIHKQMSREYQKIIIAGSDLPNLSIPIIRRCFNELYKHDVVIAPALDGGYGLLGTNGFIDLYSPITNWESRSPGYDLFKETKELIANKNLKLYQTETFFDIDYKEDVQRTWHMVTHNGQLKPNFQYLKRTFEVMKENKDKFDL